MAPALPVAALIVRLEKLGEDLKALQEQYDRRAKGAAPGPKKDDLERMADDLDRLWLKHFLSN